MKTGIEETALRYLSSRNRTFCEMKKHLAGKGFCEEEIRELTERYRRCGYLDDEEYCRQYIRYGLGKGKSRRRILYELREKGVEQSLAENIFEDFLEEEAVEYDERSRAFSEAEKVIRTGGQPLSEKILGRVARRLQSRGYGSDVICSILRELRERDTEE